MSSVDIPLSEKSFGKLLATARELPNELFPELNEFLKQYFGRTDSNLFRESGRRPFVVNIPVSDEVLEAAIDRAALSHSSLERLFEAGVLEFLASR